MLLKQKDVSEKEFNAKLIELSDSLIDPKRECNKIQHKLNTVSEEKEVLIGHITKLETVLLKQGQTNQTIFLKKPKNSKVMK